MLDICHPSYHKIRELGCQDELKIATAFSVYIDLCEVHRLWDVEHNYKPELDLIYLSAKKNRNTTPIIYVPWSSKNDISLRDTENIHKQLNCPCFILVVKSGDSTSIFYELNIGMKKPLGPPEIDGKCGTHQQKSALEKNIKRNSRNLYELAKSGDKEVKLTPCKTNVNDQAAPL